MSKRKIKKARIIIILVVLLIASIIVTTQQFTVKDIKATGNLVRFDTLAPGNSDTFKFDDYTVKIWSTHEIDYFSSCKELNTRCDCYYKVTSTDALGCDLYEYKLRKGKYDYPGNDRRDGDSCSLSSKCRDFGYCKAYCDDKIYTSGGARFYDEKTGCYWYGQIFYKGKKVTNWYNNNIKQENPKWQSGSERIYLTADGKVGTSSLAGHFYNLQFGSSYSGKDSRGDMVCQGINGGVQLSARSNDFTWEVENPMGAIFTGENRNIVIKLTQDLATFKGKLNVEYEINTQIGDVKKIDIIDVVVKKGENKYTVPIPTLQPTNKLKVTPSIDLSYDVSAWTHNTDFTKVPTGYIGNIKGDTVEFLINPKLNWLDKELCGENCEACDGYSISIDKSICINNEVRDVSCAVIGCPVVEDHQILCMSSGFCSEIVEVFIDREVKINETQCNEQCAPLGGVCQLSDNKDWYCIDKEIVEIIKELPVPIYIAKTCADFNLCDEEAGFVCKDSNIDGEVIATCERVVEKTVIDTRTVEKLNVPIITFIIALSLIIATIIYTRKK